MSRRLGKEYWTEFVEEMRTYIPQIRTGIEEAVRDPSAIPDLAAAAKLSHALKGAASIVGLTGLSHAAYFQEEMLEEVVDGKRIWVTNSTNGTLARLNASDGSPAGAPITVGALPIGVCFDGTNIWVANRGSNTASKM